MNVEQSGYVTGGGLKVGGAERSSTRWCHTLCLQGFSGFPAGPLWVQREGVCSQDSGLENPWPKFSWDQSTSQGFIHQGSHRISLKKGFSNTCQRSLSCTVRFVDFIVRTSIFNKA